MNSDRIGRPEARRLAEDEFRRFAELTAALTPDEWAMPTDCAAWDVRKIALHVLGSADAQASVREFVHQLRRGLPLNKQIDSHHWVDGLNEVQVREREHLSNAELVGQLKTVGPKAVKGPWGTPPPMRFAPKLRTVLASTPALPVMLVVVLAGNLASGGVFAVALPVLAHQRFGASGYGLLLAALAAGAVAGTTIGAWIRARRPAVTAGRLFLAQTAALVLFPIAGLAGAAVAAIAFGLANAVGELIIVTALQRSFPPAFLGRIMGLVMLASAGAFPISVALTTAVVHSAGAAAAFPLAGALTAAAILFGLSRRAFRGFAAEPGA